MQRALQGLIDTQLIESVRQGQIQPNRLYLLKPELNIEVSENKEKDPENPVNKRTRQIGVLSILIINKLFRFT